MPKIIPVDFETEAIEKRPVYPPVPVGVSINNKYYSWGHPTENNCTKTEAKKLLKQVFTQDIPLFHNAAFDIAVAMSHMGCPFPKIDFHDTMLLAFLYDPRAKSLSLKPMADLYLDMPPEEQLELKEWIEKNIFEAHGKKPTKKDPWGAHIAEAPGRLVGKYAIGDTVRTEELFYFFMPYVEEQGMLTAYEREKADLPIFEDMSSTGIKVREGKLRRDLKTWKKQYEEWEHQIRKRLKSPELDINSNVQLADAIERTGKLCEEGWIMTPPSMTYPDGQRSTKRENLVKVCTDKKLVELLGLYGMMGTFISTFAEPWLATAQEFDGRVYPNFNQVRSTDDWSGKFSGTKTGRPSSNNPNFLNVPRNQENPLLPNMRNYIAPDDGHVLLIRDYSQQEVRILAHYEEGLLYEAYLRDPNLDVHTFVGDLIHQVTGLRFPRKYIKILNFGMIYGMGVPGLMIKLDIPEEEARLLKRSHEKALPGVKSLSKDITKHCRRGNPIYTWGGREYYSEEPMIIKGRKKEFHYKQLNHLIQGSAADCTKEAMIRVHNAIRPYGGRLVLQVYDEIVTSVPKEDYKQCMSLQKEAMESVEFDIPMLSDGKIGRVSWGEAKDYKD